MDLLKESSIQILTSGLIFTYRSKLFSAPNNPLALFCLGIATTYFCQYVLPLRYNPGNMFTSEFVRRRLKRMRASGRAINGADVRDMYGLEHVFMNLDLEPPTMWENVGYWKNAAGSFPKACRDMFDEMLRISGALDHGPANILELGCGCVEGALSILSSRSQDLASYVGLNINGVQTNFCQERLQQWTSQQRQTGGLKVPQTLSVFRADASRPDTWSPDLAKDLETALLFDNDNSSGYPPRNNWVIAADCLYHFKAGREKILSHVCKHFGASLVATDYIQPDNMTGMQQFLLAVFLEMIQVPWPNKLTRQEYIDLLVRCGYDKSSVQIVDITDHVWTPYADFLKRQTARWDEIGGSPEAVRPFRHFGWVMRYFAYAGTLRQVIVVARTRREPSDSKE